MAFYQENILSIVINTKKNSFNILVGEEEFSSVRIIAFVFVD